MAGRRLIVPKKARSKVWQYFGFEADESGSKSDRRHVICRVCNKKLMFCGSTTNLSSHMEACQKRMSRYNQLYQGTSQASAKASSNVSEDLQNGSADILEEIMLMDDQDVLSEQEANVPVADDEPISILASSESKQDYCLKWKHYQANQHSMFFRMLKIGRFCDVFIVCEEKLMKAHKLVLSACSSYFEKVLSHFEDKNPVLILKDVKHRDMVALLQFMYKGEVNIKESQLTSLLNAAEFLKVKGLSDICAEGQKLLFTTQDAGADTETSVQQDSEPCQINRNQDSEPSRSGQRSKRILSNMEEQQRMKIQRVSEESSLKNTPQPRLEISHSNSEPGDKPEKPQHNIEGIVQLNNYLKGTGTYETFWKEPWVVQAMKDTSKKHMTVKDCSVLLGVPYGIMYTHYRQMKSSEVQPTTVSQEGGEIILKCHEIATVSTDRSKTAVREVDPGMPETTATT